MTTQLTPAQPPTPTRLRRTALLAVGAAIAITLVVAAVTLVRSGTPAREASAPPEPTPERPAEPGFLDQAPRTIDQRALEELLARQADFTPPPQEESFPDEAAAGDFTAEAAAAAPAPRDERAEALARALRAPLEPTRTASPSLRSSPEEALGQVLPTAREIRDLLAPQGLLPNPLPRLTLPPRVEGSGGASPRSTQLAYTLERPSSPYRLQAGTVLPAILLTAVNSDLPGTVVAQLARDVYDSTAQTHLLLPRGSRLVGRYENQIALGQNRLLVAWDRLLLPDGTSLSLPGLPSAAGSGEAGLAGSVDNHYGRVFGNAILLSLLSAGVQLSQPQQSATAGQAPVVRPGRGGALGQELGTVAARARPPQSQHPAHHPAPLRPRVPGAARGRSHPPRALRAPALTDTWTMPKPSSPEILQLPVDAIAPDPDQPRQRFDETKLEELAETIRTSSVLQPVTVTRNTRPDVEAPYLLLFGARRFLAPAAGLTECPPPQGAPA